MAFKEWLLNEGLESFSNGGKVKLYHFTRSNPFFQTELPKTLILDPTKFGQNSYTRNDAKASGMPRVFFYLDPKEQESFVTGNLYTAIVNAKDIYDVLEDKDQIKADLRKNNRGILQMDALLYAIKEAGYKGVYYNPGFHVVNWFYPIKTTKKPAEMGYAP